MVLEYILIGVIAFSIGRASADDRSRHNHREKYYTKVVHKHKKHKFRTWKKRHSHRNHTINMMCRNGWEW